MMHLFASICTCLLFLFIVTFIALYFIVPKAAQKEVDHINLPHKPKVILQNLKLNQLSTGKVNLLNIWTDLYIEANLHVEARSPFGIHFDKTTINLEMQQLMNDKTYGEWKPLATVDIPDIRIKAHEFIDIPLDITNVQFKNLGSVVLHDLLFPSCKYHLARLRVSDHELRLKPSIWLPFNVHLNNSLPEISDATGNITNTYIVTTEPTWQPTMKPTMTPTKHWG